MITCQIGLYPLRSEEITGVVDEAMKIINSYDLEVEIGTMSTVVAGDTGTVYKMLNELTQEMQSRGREFVLTITVSTSCDWKGKQ